LCGYVKKSKVIAALVIAKIYAKCKNVLSKTRNKISVKQECELTTIICKFPALSKIKYKACFNLA